MSECAIVSCPVEAFDDFLGMGCVREVSRPAQGCCFLVYELTHLIGGCFMFS